MNLLDPKQEDEEKMIEMGFTHNQVVNILRIVEKENPKDLNELIKKINSSRMNYLSKKSATKKIKKKFEFNGEEKTENKTNKEFGFKITTNQQTDKYLEIIGMLKAIKVQIDEIEKEIKNK